MASQPVQTEQPKPALSEAPASLNFFGITEKGWNIQFTLRDMDEYNLIARFGKLVKTLEENYHVKPKPVGSQPNREPAAPPPPEQQAATRHENGGADGSFAAEKLVGNVSEGKISWKVKGGKFSKFGVTIWPEVLEASGLYPDQLDPMQQYNLAGYTAYFVNTEEGKPQKVTRLVK